MLRILIVDDQKTIRTVLITALRSYGFEAVGVEGAISALREFETSEYDLAIVDVYMPKIDGVKLIKALRDRVPEFPIIAMSGVLLNESEHTALEYFPNFPNLSGVVRLQKPFRPLDLLKAVQSALGGRVKVSGGAPCQAF